MLEIRNLTKRFHGAAVVDNVSFALRPGEITGYLGPNGSGKSTTVKILAGLLHASSGHIFYTGQNVSDDPVAFRRRLGYVPEEPNLYGYLTGLEYLQLAGGLRGLAESVVTERANRLLELLSLSNRVRGIRQTAFQVRIQLPHEPQLIRFEVHFLVN